MPATVSIAPGGARATIEAPNGTVSTAAAPRVVVVGGGARGPAGETLGRETYEAAADIGGQRAVGLNGSGLLVAADATSGTPAIGLTRDAVGTGAEVAVYRAGSVSGWSGLTPGAVYYLRDGGTVSATPPAEGLLQVVGRAASATEMLSTPGEPIQL